ncbi:MAG: FAD-binding protein [Alphaproteobacteria bacterium]|nr:FAD-binding protein [Alphaproteobacteria bacterium]
MALLVTNIPWPGDDGDPRPALAARLGVPTAAVAEVTLLRRSVDGRRRPPRWQANYRVQLSEGEDEALARRLHGVRRWTDRDQDRHRAADPPRAPRQRWPRDVRPLIIGAGPAGLFAALRLSEAGAPAILLERGAEVDARLQDVRAFWRRGVLDPESNVVFGEGGAGAFSDGKIYTRRRDGELGWVFRRLVDMGADPEILEEGWAHLGTDRIQRILPTLRAHLRANGVDLRFNTAARGFLVEGGRCVGVRLDEGELRGGPVIVATGHSARDVWAAMLDAGAAAERRPIHIGARVEHPQRLIDEARYGSPRGDLPPASYRLTSNPPARRGPPAARRAHTFCMCPGGTVVAATNHPERVVVNGMSYSKRQAWWANSAVIVEVHPDDYPGEDPLAGVRYQDAIEARAFAAGGGGFKAPAQRVEDLLAGRASTELPRVSYPLGATPCDLRAVLPEPLIIGMIAALRHFDRRLPGFAGPEGVLIAPETRTTAPLRFLRGPDLASTTLPGLMPVGEGAGYAGGIVSAALDGYRAANALVERFAPRLHDPYDP